MQIFEVCLFFKLRTAVQQKTVKPTYHCQEAGGRKRNGEHTGVWVNGDKSY